MAEVAYAFGGEEFLAAGETVWREYTWTKGIGSAAWTRLSVAPTQPDTQMQIIEERTIWRLDEAQVRWALRLRNPGGIDAFYRVSIISVS